MNIRICSRDEVEKLLAGGFPQKTAVISFYDPPSKRTGKPNAPVEYSERAERVFYIPLYDLDVDILEEYGLTFKTYFPEADRLAEFIYQAKLDGMDLICQCEYGQSRSAACAAAIEEHFYRRGIDIFADYRYYPNQLVFNKLKDALERERRRREIPAAGGETGSKDGDQWMKQETPAKRREKAEIRDISTCWERLTNAVFGQTPIDIGQFQIVARDTFRLLSEADFQSISNELARLLINVEAFSVHAMLMSFFSLTATQILSEIAGSLVKQFLAGFQSAGSIYPKLRLKDGFSAEWFDFIKDALTDLRYEDELPF